MLIKTYQIHNVDRYRVQSQFQHFSNNTRVQCSLNTEFCMCLHAKKLGGSCNGLPILHRMSAGIAVMIMKH